MCYKHKAHTKSNPRANVIKFWHQWQQVIIYKSSLLLLWKKVMYHPSFVNFSPLLKIQIPTNITHGTKHRFFSSENHVPFNYATFHFSRLFNFLKRKKSSILKRYFHHLNVLYLQKKPLKGREQTKHWCCPFKRCTPCWCGGCFLRF